MPKAVEVTVSAGRTFNHPHESYSNLKPVVTVRAFVGEGEDWQEVTKALQAKAELLVEDHKQHMLRSLDELHEMGLRQAEANRLDRQIREFQERLDRLREGAPALAIEREVSDGPEDPDDERDRDRSHRW